jgi:DNA-binding CsgD family transcriptional regulator
VTVVVAGTPIPADTAGTILMVDDAHLLDETTLRSLRERLRTSATALLMATRPWPRSEALATLCEELEQAQPSLILGHVTKSDVLDHLDEEGRRIEDRCLDSILELTGHLTWLVSEALAVHEDARCAENAEHDVIREELRDLIAHRIAHLDESLRAAVESLSLSPRDMPDDLAHWRIAGHAKGLLQRNGQPAPVVREAVRTTTSIDRLVALYASSRTPAGPADPAMHELIEGVRDPRVAAALLLDGDAALPLNPRRAGELFLAAGEAGADEALVAVRRARAAWATGEIDAAATLLDTVDWSAGHPDLPSATAIAGALWAARGDMRMSAAVAGTRTADTPDAIARTTIAAVGAGDKDLLEAREAVPPARSLPSTLAVAQDVLARGLRATLTADTETCLGDLVRATEMYTASRSIEPMPELPAVLAAIVAMSLGELAVAASVVDTAVLERHGGGWAQPRLLLWKAWIAVQRERPFDAEAALRDARAHGALAPRDDMLADAVDIALTRRYADSSALVSTWRRARESILRTRFDLYALYPLGEFALSAAQLDDYDRMRPHLDEMFARISSLGSPPVWSAPLHWAGLHCSIQLNRPDDLTVHARALLAAAPHSRAAAKMATAGRVWTDVLTGVVDVDAIERAAMGLAAVGLAWDGARLAGRGAARSEDRRVIGRLLACARQLHPREELGQSASDDAAGGEPAVARASDVLSIREREVAALVVQGKTYAEIGESIFISPRTAEHHIARIRRRLGATSRSDLISKLRLVLDDDAGSDAFLLSATDEYA